MVEGKEKVSEGSSGTQLPFDQTFFRWVGLGLQHLGLARLAAGARKRGASAIEFHTWSRADPWFKSVHDQPRRRSLPALCNPALWQLAAGAVCDSINLQSKVAHLQNFNG